MLQRKGLIRRHWALHSFVYVPIVAGSLLACVKSPPPPAPPVVVMPPPEPDPPEPVPPAPPPVWSAIDAPPQDSASSITFEWLDLIEGASAPTAPQLLPEHYSEIPGILSFRGDTHRANATHGTVQFQKKTLRVIWTFETKVTTPKAQNSSLKDWGGGAGWTGQPAVIQWPEETKKAMNLLPEHKNNPDFVEVIQGSLDGYIYFLDLKTGAPSRTASFFNPITKRFDAQHINIRNPIKGSVSLDPRGYPLLYVGQGIRERGDFGFRVFSLVDGQRLLFLNGKDTEAPRRWGAFDSSALINREADTLFVPGENGLLYAVILNTEFSPDTPSITLNPQIHRMKYAHTKASGRKKGVENTLAGWKNLIWFGDNGGIITCMDLNTYQPVWSWFGSNADDTNATIAVEIEGERPFLYLGTEVEYQASPDQKAWIHKFDGLTGTPIWSVGIPARHAVRSVNLDGGVYGSPVLGQNNLSDLVFVPVAETGTVGHGLLLALNKVDGTERWRWNMEHFAWSSPVAVYDAEGHGYLILGDNDGFLTVLDGATGTVIQQLPLLYNIEASPAVYGNTMVLGVRGSKIHGIQLE